MDAKIFASAAGWSVAWWPSGSHLTPRSDDAPLDGVCRPDADAKIFASLQITVNQYIAQDSGVDPEGYTDGGRTWVPPYNLLIISLLLKHEIDCAEEAEGGGGVVPVELLVFEE